MLTTYIYYFCVCTYIYIKLYVKEQHTDFHMRMFCDVNVMLHYRQRPPAFEEQVFIYMYFGDKK